MSGLGSKTVWGDFKEPGIEFGEYSAFHTSQPPGKWPNGSPDKGFCGKRIEIPIGKIGGNP
jgi:hypothetical protein